jgi:uncharacterized protein (DUF2384 family)
MTSRPGPLPSESLAMISLILNRASRALGSSECAERWLRKPNPELGGQTPLECLDTEAGSTTVFQLLNAIRSVASEGAA